VGDSSGKLELIPHTPFGGKGASPWKLSLLDEPA
jgi:hypothetical protein